jgi:hypothetical protein
LILLKAGFGRFGTLRAMGQKLKQALSRHELEQLLNWELQAYEGCDGCHFSGVEPAASGWSAHIDVDRPIGTVEYAIADAVLEQTRRVFDLR